MDFTGAILDGANFTGAILKGAKFLNVQAKKAKFINANLNEAVLSGSFTGSTFRGADLTTATFESTYLDKNNDSLQTNLSDCKFSRALLNEPFEGLNLTGANLSGAIISHKFKLQDCIIDVVKAYNCTVVMAITEFQVQGDCLRTLLQKNSNPDPKTPTV